MHLGESQVHLLVQTWGCGKWKEREMGGLDHGCGKEGFSAIFCDSKPSKQQKPTGFDLYPERPCSGYNLMPPKWPRFDKWPRPLASSCRAHGFVLEAGVFQRQDPGYPRGVWHSHRRLARRQTRLDPKAPELRTDPRSSLTRHRAPEIRCSPALC